MNLGNIKQVLNSTLMNFSVCKRSNFVKGFLWLEFYFYKKKLKKRKNVNAHNYGQWIGVEKNFMVIKPHIIYFVKNFDSINWNFDKI